MTVNTQRQTPRGLARGENGVGSLLEILILLTVTLAMASVAVPAIGVATRHYRLSIGAQAVAQQLNLCRQRAVASNQTTSVLVTDALAQFDTNYNGIYGDAGGTGVPADEGPHMFDATGISITAADSPIVRTFTARGELPLAMAPETQAITVRYAGLSRTVSIDPRGAVSVGPAS
jgi:Tfp pilus assembly protein FimT